MVVAERLLAAQQAAAGALLDRRAEIGRQLGQDAPELGTRLRVPGQPARPADPFAEESLVDIGAVGHAVAPSSQPRPGVASGWSCQPISASTWATHARIVS